MTLKAMAQNVITLIDVEPKKLTSISITSQAGIWIMESYRKD
jgi:hypothetical protein